METRISVAKVNKSLSDNGGDIIEVIERPNNGISLVFADGQIYGESSRSISSSVVRSVISLLADGVRDGAAARAASDQLYSSMNGTAQASLNILSVDLQTRTIVLTRNNPIPIFVARDVDIECIQSDSSFIGNSQNIRPSISEFTIESRITIILFSDGIYNAGKKYNTSIDICTLLESQLDEMQPSPDEITNTILSEAIRLDQGRPLDDMSVIVLRIFSQSTDSVRRLSISFPFP